MSFKSIFISVFIGTALVAIALIFNTRRPATDTRQPSPDFVRATKKCTTCHLRETSAVVHQFERSEHAKQRVSCLDCHRAVEGQEAQTHRGFTITKHLEKYHKGAVKRQANKLAIAEGENAINIVRAELCLCPSVPQRAYREI